MPTVNPYLYFNGNCEAAFLFYQKVFGTDIAHLERYQDAPKSDRHLFQEADDKIMHATLPISQETFLMGADHSEVYEGSKGQKHFSLILHADSQEEADRLFAGLSAGGTIKLDLHKTFWGSYFGICIDPFGISWKIIANAGE